MHEHEIRPRFLPVLDTLIVCAAVLQLLTRADDSWSLWALLLAAVWVFSQLSPYSLRNRLVGCAISVGFAILSISFVALYFPWRAHDTQSYRLLPLIAIGALAQVLPYWKRGPSFAFSELAFFYVDVSIWDVLTGRVPHDRIHPDINGNHCPVCDNPPSLYKIHGAADLVAFVLIGFPLLLSIIGLKISALVYGPLLYVGLSFRAKDFNALGLAARAEYRSSFKQLGLLIGYAGIAIFLGKVVVYSYWNRFVDWWLATPVVSLFDNAIRPAAFLPFHLTFVLGSVLLIVTTFLVDRSIHRMLDVGETPDQMPMLLRSIRALTRLRQILALYSWICFIWLSVPLLRGFRFPPVTLELFPR